MDDNDFRTSAPVRSLLRQWSVTDTGKLHAVRAVVKDVLDDLDKLREYARELESKVDAQAPPQYDRVVSLALHEASNCLSRATGFPALVIAHAFLTLAAERVTPAEAPCWIH